MYGAARLCVLGGLLLGGSPLASAAFEGNLNYDSPSTRHVNLGIDVPRVHRRSFKRDAVAYEPSQLNFTHGVASGDPWPNSVVLWTRVAPSLDHDWSNVTVAGTAQLYNHDTEQYIKADPNPICVDWKVVLPDDDASAVSSGRAYTTSDIDYTVKVGYLRAFRGSLIERC
jgi:alkaline phosphatase D